MSDPRGPKGLLEGERKVFAPDHASEVGSFGVKLTGNAEIADLDRDGTVA
jgi:hypothetical protein